MKTDDDVLAEALRSWSQSGPGLSEALADRVGRVARVQLAPPPAAAAPSWGFTLREALVPALLMSATVIRTADTVNVAQRVFGQHDDASDTGEDGPG